MDILDSEKLILELNFRNDIIDERRPKKAFDSQKMFKLLPETVLDKRTLEVVEIHDLFKAVDHTTTEVGSARLFHSLVNPPDSIELIHAKQDSYCELESNQKLQESLSSLLEKFKEGENGLFKFLNGHMHPLIAYNDYKHVTTFIQEILQEMEEMPQPETVYLDSLFKSILSFNGSQVKSIITKGGYRTLRGIFSKAEKAKFGLSVKFRRGRIGFGTILPALPGLYFGFCWMFGLLYPGFAKAMFLATSWMSVLGIMYGLALKPIIDYETAILPIRKRLLDSNRFCSAIEGIAAIDELLSFVKFAAIMPHPTVMPEVTNEDSHIFICKDLRNPISAKTDTGFVANDIYLTTARITFVTGPNSGGKTTYCKTIVQNQLLGQIGAPVVASGAMMNMADKITYQAPAFDTLADPEGRFGTELKVTRDVFYSVTPKSLAILDEIAEGTTTHEKLSFSIEIMKGFCTIANNTLLVTHSYELVERFKEQGMGQFLKVEFEGDDPTHRLIEGVSKDSHALRVASKIGFSPQDMQSHLKEKGYLAEA